MDNKIHEYILGKKFEVLGSYISNNSCGYMAIACQIGYPPEEYQTLRNIVACYYENLSDSEFNFKTIPDKGHNPIRPKHIKPVSR